MGILFSCVKKGMEFSGREGYEGMKGYQSTGGYLFVHFTGETESGEQVYFSLSRDGLHWQDLNGGKPVLQSFIGEMGVRDPFILRSEIDGSYYILATDLRIASGKGWDAALKQGSTKILVWTSANLTEWSRPWTVELSVQGAGCVWAPEAVYDPQEKAYLVFWASMVREKGEAQGKHRIYCSYTRDFIEFTEPEKYMERKYDVIDMTIIREGHMFYRFFKDETTKNICMDKGKQLRGSFEPVCSHGLNGIKGVEGPAVFPLDAPHTWCLLVDRFASNQGYMPLLTRDLSMGEFQILPKDAYNMGENQKRHGSVLVLDEKEYKAIGMSDLANKIEEE